MCSVAWVYGSEDKEEPNTGRSKSVSDEYETKPRECGSFFARWTCNANNNRYLTLIVPYVAGNMEHNSNGLMLALFQNNAPLAHYWDK